MFGSLIAVLTRDCRNGIDPRGERRYNMSVEKKSLLTQRSSVKKAIMAKPQTSASVNPATRANVRAGTRASVSPKISPKVATAVQTKVSASDV